ncbi:phosphoenolpyruvate-dependent sugar phosphotransferase system, EIIA 2 [Cutibacterium modestum 30N]|nr:phosphoenolpyruvate-dependent sugar phosphotransferase system, EIIA 2 [Cutibacterium modestum P08]MCP2375771.1 phosphoenolpyruvate-dependent sugar phosphotransferase system, EIIA 2 [Cutibacterium modestum 28N]MCP2379293.1 phosphoenolpyruvate-dependent sugar phosphotransferase system, EIIA 2 [Cutibacterium modestum 31N]MCP2380473.1 phosphoenolpyruvate-dependent sugar phosphotransferase system, EIIA 2 [Cutibacterium modestum 30N]
MIIHRSSSMPWKGASRLIVANVTATNQNDLFAQVNDCLTADNMVEPTFLSAVTAREMRFPTGLDFGYVSIAIPHVDPEHVISPGVLVCRNSTSTTFRAMDGPERGLDVQLSIWPLVTDPSNQVDMLGAVITLIQDESSYPVLLHGDQTEVVDRISCALAPTED